MVQILPRPKSTSDRFAEAFANIGQQLPIELQQIQNTRKLNQQKRLNDLSGLDAFVHKSLKYRSLGETVGTNPKSKEFIRNRVQDLIKAGMGRDEAFDEALMDYHNSKNQSKGKGKKSFAQQLQGEDEEQKNLPFIQKLLGGIGPPPPQTPFNQKKLTHDLGAGLIKEHPGKSLGILGLGAVAPYEEVLRYQSPAAKELIKNLGFTNYQEERPELYSEKARKALYEGLTPKQIKAAEKVELLGGLLPLERLVGLVSKGVKGSKAIYPSQILGPEEKMLLAAPQKAQKATIDIGQALPAPSTRSLTGRVSKQELTPTEMRVQRSNPEARIYPRTKNIAIREAQVKSFPKYEAEIAQDATERAERAESKIPKTDKGKESKRLRIFEAEKNWPKAQDSYNKAAGRVRALEDEVGTLKGEAKTQAQIILDLAKKDLEDATFGVKQAFENLKGVNTRAGAPAMREAAQRKILQIQDAVAAGEDYQLAKMDYSPDLITKAKKISAKAPILKTKESDFYTQVHQEYVREYQKRLDRINSEIKGLPRTMAGLSKGRELQLEKNILNKMIESADSERIIQNRRFGLRETAERKKAQERFAKLKQSEGKPHVQQAAQEKMWKERFKEIKTQESRAKAAEDIVEDAAQQSKTAQEAAKIRGEKENLKAAFEDLANEEERLKDRFKTQGPQEPPSGKGTTMEFQRSFSRKAEHFVRGFAKMFDKFMEKSPNLSKFWKSSWGKHILVGIGTALFDEALKEFQLNEYMTGGQTIGLIFGKRTFKGVSQRALGYLINHVIRAQFKKLHVSRAAKAYENDDEEKFKSYSPKIKKLARDKVNSY